MIRRDDIRGAIDAEFVAGVAKLFAVMTLGFSDDDVVDHAAHAKAFGDGIARHKRARELALEVIEQQFRSDL